MKHLITFLITFFGISQLYSQIIINEKFADNTALNNWTVSKFGNGDIPIVSNDSLILSSLGGSDGISGFRDGVEIKANYLNLPTDYKQYEIAGNITELLISSYDSCTPNVNFYAKITSGEESIAVGITGYDWLYELLPIGNDEYQYSYILNYSNPLFHRVAVFQTVQGVTTCKKLINLALDAYYKLDYKFVNENDVWKVYFRTDTTQPYTIVNTDLISTTNIEILTGVSTSVGAYSIKGYHDGIGKFSIGKFVVTNNNTPTNLTIAAKSDAITINLNAVTNELQVKGIEGKAIFSLIDLNGKVVFSKDVINEETISSSSLSQGVYIVQIITKSGIINNKLIKQ